jgi:hypothetical protein
MYPLASILKDEAASHDHGRVGPERRQPASWQDMPALRQAPRFLRGAPRRLKRVHGAQRQAASSPGNGL